jgi:hypothetical protein
MRNTLILLTAALLILCGCEKKATTEGNTAKIHCSVTASGEPVNAAAILLTPGGGVKITGSDGMYEFAGLEPGKYEMKVFKEGFLSFNQSVDVSGSEDKEVTATLTKSAGKLSINKAYIDMGSNESNNMAGFSLVNSGDAELAWNITNAAGWITNVDPATGTVSANGSTAVVITIDRSRLSANSNENYATLVARSTTAGDGSIAELLVTVFGKGDGTNMTISDKDFVKVGEFYVMTKDMGGRMDWTSANNACENATIGGFNDWTLPNTSELGTLYSKKEVIGGFVTDIPSSNIKEIHRKTAYWTKDKSPNASYPYYWMSFYDGFQGYSYIDNDDDNYDDHDDDYKRRCRCVRKSSPIPVVTTLRATNITAATATLNGKIENAGEPPYTERGFVYSNIFQNPTVEDDASATVKRVVSGTSIEFSANIAGLTSEATYYVRAYATNSNGTGYGESVAIADYTVLQSEGLMVQNNDISSGATLDAANTLCQSSRVGGYSNWRVPTLGELRALYNNRSTIGGFSTTLNGSWYWSSTAYNDYAYYWVNFYDGTYSWSGSTNSCRVRAVRTLP